MNRVNRLLPYLLGVSLALLAITVVHAAASTRTARAEPEPCALPAVKMPAEIELHDGMSATEANYKQWLSAELDGGTKP